MDEEAGREDVEVEEVVLLAATRAVRPRVRIVRADFMVARLGFAWRVELRKEVG